MIWENLEYSRISQLSRALIIYFISFILIALSFYLILKISYVQFSFDKVNDLIPSATISIVITVINLIMEELLHQLTDMEKLYSKTEQNISFSLKFSIVSLYIFIFISYILHCCSKNNYFIVIRHFFQKIFSSWSYLNKGVF